MANTYRRSGLLVAALAASVLTGCSSEAPSEPSATTQPTATSNVDQPIPDEGGGLQTGLLTFGQSAESQYPGLYVKVKPPKRTGDFSSTAASSNTAKIGTAAKGYTNFTTKIVYKNKTDKPLNIQGEALDAFAGDKGLSCARVFDQQVPGGLDLGTGVLRARGTKTYTAAWSCKGKKGADLTVSAVARPSDMREPDEPLSWGGVLP